MLALVLYEITCLTLLAKVPVSCGRVCATMLETENNSRKLESVKLRIGITGENLVL